MNNGYNFNFTPNTSYMRDIANPMVQMPYMTRPTALPRLSSLFRGSGPLAARNVATGTSKITFSGILNGASKTLGVINQAIPVFYQVKPIWNNARTMFKVVKGLNSSDETSNSSVRQENVKKKEPDLKSNAPIFFD